MRDELPVFVPELHNYIRQLQAQNAVLREALEEMRFYRGAFPKAVEDMRLKALSITLSECLDQARKKDDIIGSALTTLQNIMKHQATLVSGDEKFNGAAYFMAKREIERIEAARAAGVEV